MHIKILYPKFFDHNIENVLHIVYEIVVSRLLSFLALVLFANFEAKSGQTAQKIDKHI